MNSISNITDIKDMIDDKVDHKTAGMKKSYDTIISMLLAMDGSLIRFIDRPSRKQCMIAIHQSDGGNIKYIKYPTFKMWKESLHRDPQNIQLIDGKMMNEQTIVDLFKIAIKKDVGCIQYAYKFLKDSDKSLYIDLVQHAIDIHKEAWYCCEYITPDQCFKLIQKGAHPECCTKVKHKSDEFYKALIEFEPRAIAYIPQSDSLCLSAVEKDPYCLLYVNPEHLTTDVCKAAACRPVMFQYIPEYKLTPDICKQYLSVSDFGISEIPSELLDDDLCEYYIKKCETKHWNYLKKYVKNKHLRIKTMKILKSLGKWKVVYPREDKTEMTDDEKWAQHFTSTEEE